MLELHHIVERTELGTNNSEMNLVSLCPICHAKIHDHKLKIYGVYPSTEPPHGRTIIYELNGKCNIPELKSKYLEYKPKQMIIFNGEQDEG